MSEKVLIGQGRKIVELPRNEWEQGLSQAPAAIADLLKFMSADHHLVRNFAVREIPNAGKPLSPEFIAKKLKMPLRRVNEILIDLEKHLVFLFRNSAGDVTWAYPVTCETTPHHFTFKSGEQTYAA
ncbi:MAG: hypothetical protein V3W18_05075 [candidate division Zixibacteria bacterium]